MRESERCREQARELWGQQRSWPIKMDEDQEPGTWVTGTSSRPGPSDDGSRASECSAALP